MGYLFRVECFGLMGRLFGQFSCDCLVLRINTHTGNGVTAVLNE